MTDGNDGNAESANLQEQMAQMMALAQQQQQSITQLTAAVDANSKAMEEQRAAMQQQLANVAPSGLAHGTPGLGTAAAAAAPQGLLASMSAALPARNLSRFPRALASRAIRVGGWHILVCVQPPRRDRHSVTEQVPRGVPTRRAGWVFGFPPTHDPVL